MNPSHLREGTHTENMRDMCERDRSAKGSRVYASKLTEEDVLEIRKLNETTETTSKEIGELFGVSELTISRIIARQTWKHVS